jgi:hypothetical protein
VGSTSRGAAAVLATLGLVVGGGCGYGFAAGAGRLPAGAERVFVPPLENRTTDSEAGAIVAASLRQELARRQADGGPGSGARIDGRVEESSFYASSPNGATYRLALVVSARLVVGGAVVAEQRARRDEEWLAGIDALESEGRRRLAMRRAADGLAREILERFERP